MKSSVAWREEQWQPRAPGGVTVETWQAQAATRHGVPKGEVMRLNRRDLAAMMAGAMPALAQPAHAITLVVPFSPGGSADITARILASHAQRMLPEPWRITVENRAGASGAVGTQSVARATADGRTLLLARVGSSAILPATDTRTAFGWDDFTFLGLLDENPYLLAVRADAPWANLEALANGLRDAPGRLRFATSGPATILDLGVRQFFVAAGLELDAGTAVVLRGGADAVAALLDGQVDFIGNNLPELSGPLREGRLRALAVSGTAPLPGALTGVPLMRDAGYPALEALVGWSALAGPPHLPPGIVALWADVLARLAQDPAWLEETARFGSRPRVLDPAATRGFIGDQVEMYRALARRLGLA